MIYNNIIKINVHQQNVNISPSSYDTDKILILTEQEKNNYINQCTSLLNQSKTINFGKMIHTDNLCNVPRFKLKEFFHQNNLKRTSRREQCDTIILDKNNLTDILYFFNKINNKAYIINKFDNHDLSVTLNYFFDKQWKNHYRKIAIRDTISRINQNNTFIIVDEEIYNTKYYIKEFRKIIESSEATLFYYDDLYRNKNIEETIKLLDFLQTHPNTQIIYDEYLLELLNSDGIELDNDYLDTIENMFKSNQEDNIKLAIEMLSNVNLQKDSLTIALLLNKYQHVFTHGSKITPSSMNSFKSIDKYYKSCGIIWKSDWRIFANSLYKSYSNNPEQKQIIESFILKNINDYISMPGMPKKTINFKLNSIVLEF